MVYIYSLNDKALELLDKFVYLSSNILSNENGNNINI